MSRLLDSTNFNPTGLDQVRPGSSYELKATSHKFQQYTSTAPRPPSKSVQIPWQTKHFNTILQILDSGQLSFSLFA